MRGFKNMLSSAGSVIVLAPKRSRRKSFVKSGGFKKDSESLAKDARKIMVDLRNTLAKF